MSALSKYKTYPEYKVSDVMLFKKIPQHWNLLRYKNILSIFQGMAFKSDSYVDDSNVLNIRMGNIKKGGNIDLTHNIKYLPNDYKNIFKEYRLYSGDIIIAMTDMSPSLDFLAVPAVLEYLDDDKTYLLNQRVGKLIIAKNFNTSFIKYSLLDDSLKHQLKIKGLGTVQSNMSSEDLYSSYLSIPSLQEQTKIAEFLDHETAKIDQLIEKQQTLIELLKEKRQAVISHAVTKGLDPNVKMKDSGIEWLGEVPEHWEVSKLYYISDRVGDGLHSTPNYQDGTGYYFINGNNLLNGKIVTGDTAKEVPESEFFKHQVTLNNSTVLLSINGTIGKVAIYDDEKVILGKSAAYINCQKKLMPTYLALFLTTSEAKKYYDLEQTGTTIYNLSLNSIRNMKIPLPTISEQKSINIYIKQQIFQYDSLIQKAEQQIELMKERKTALISAAVTGKIDVRDWQPEQ